MDLLLTNARLPRGGEPPGAPPERVAIRVRGGRIAEIGRDLRPGGERELDAEGGTVLPGLVDAHVHLQSVPGATFRGDGEDARRRAWQHALRAYLACGVTTILDAAIAAPVLREIRRWVDGGGPGPRVLALGPALHPPGGYPDRRHLTDAWGPHWGPVATRDDVSARFAEYDGIPDVVGVKVFIEYGFSPFHSWPVHSAEMRAHIRREAAARRMPIFVHALQHRAHLVAMEMEPRALMHAGFGDRQPSPELVGRIREAGTHVVTTLSSNFDCWLVRREWARGIRDPLVRLAVPPDQIATAEDPRAWRDMWRHMFRVVAPRWMSPRAAGIFSRLASVSVGEASMRYGLSRACRAIRSLRSAGIRVVMGSDGGAWPLVPSCFHGYSTIREMELLAAAGMEPGAVVEAATRLPARMLGLEDEIGSVEVGRRADLLVVRGDPLADVRALRSIRWTVKGGDARTPEEWMRS